MGSCEQAVIDLASQAVSTWVTKHFETIFSNLPNSESFESQPQYPEFRNNLEIFLSCHQSSESLLDVFVILFCLV